MCQLFKQAVLLKLPSKYPWGKGAAEKSKLITLQELNNFTTKIYKWLFYILKCMWILPSIPLFNIKLRFPQKSSRKILILWPPTTPGTLPSIRGVTVSKMEAWQWSLGEKRKIKLFKVTEGRCSHSWSVKWQCWIWAVKFLQWTLIAPLMSVLFTQVYVVLIWKQRNFFTPVSTRIRFSCEKTQNNDGLSESKVYFPHMNTGSQNYNH